jgi:ATP-dependent DNA helicase RecG
MAILEDPLRLVIGDKAAKPLDRALELRTVGDLLRHYPRRYETRGELTDLASLRDGEYVTVQAVIAKVTSRPMRNRRGSIFEATVTDGRGQLVLTFFSKGRQDWRERQLAPGLHGLFSGQVSTFRGKRQLAHPDYELLEAGEDTARAAAEYAAEMIPVYPAAKEITSWQIAASVRIALDVLDIQDPVPRAIRERHGLRGLADALRGIHRPIDWADVQRSTERLKWDEAVLLQTVLEQRRLAATAYSARPRTRRADGLLDS